jgi:predicted phage terminase large subunit-like protein
MPTKAEAAAELLRRDSAVASLDCYAMERGFWPGAHHRVLTSMLQRVVWSKTKRGMVFMGPGTAKSTYTSKLTPPWAFAQPTPHGMPWDILACSHTATLAQDFSRVCRGYVRDDAPLLGFGLSEELTGVEHWATTKGDHYRCAGVQQAIAGKRGDLGIIDDPVPGREQADSETERRKTWNWYRDDFRQRLKPEASILIVMTRWHEDDLAGRILPEGWNGENGMVQARDGEWWDVVAMPSLSDGRANDPLGRTETDQSVWPEWMPVPWLRQARDSMSPRSWSAMHQQRPAPEEGDFFQRAWFGRYQSIPIGCRYFVASDWATPDGDDSTCHVVIAVDPGGRLYVADVWRGRGTTAEGIDAALDLARKYSAACWLNEKGVLWRMIAGQAQARMRERNVFVPTEEYARTADKPTMARAIQGRWSQGMVMLPEQAPWLADLEAELLRFPAGRHDDQVDALALIGMHLEHVVAPPKQSFQTYQAQPERVTW